MLNDKLQCSAKTKAKKKTSGDNKTQEPISEKERSQMLQELMRQLKHKLEACDAAIRKLTNVHCNITYRTEKHFSAGIWKPPTLPRELSSFMADMSLKPEVEATLIGDVSATFKESHELMITELRNLLKDKIRMVGK